MMFGFRRIAAGAIAGLLVLGLGACGKDKKNDASTATTETTAASGTTATTGAASTVGANAVEIKGFKFAQGTIAAGATVKVTNADTANHSVTANDSSFDTKIIAGGASGTFTAPAKAGRYPYHCAVHANMQANLIVT
jgi:plastocyanin